MKVSITEFDGCFGIDIHAETIQEAAMLTRMSVNSRVEDVTHQIFVSEVKGQNGSQSANPSPFTTAIVFQKNKRGSGELPRRR